MNNVQDGIGFLDDRDKMKAMSVACTFCAEGHSSGDCVKQSGAITPMNGRSVIPLFVAGIMSVIALGMWNVSILEMSIPARRLPSDGPRCQAATCVAWNVPFPSTLYSLMSTLSVEK